MWLIGRLTPDFKTIANFRKDNDHGHSWCVPAVHRALPSA